MRQQPERDVGVWVTSEVTADGAYAVGISVNADRAWTLSEVAAVRYARAVLRVAHTADHDAAVINLLAKKIGTPVKAAAELVAYDLRPDRPPLDDAATTPLLLRPGVAADGLRPFIALALDNEANKIGQWTVADAISHAMGVLGAVATVDLDTALHRMLVGKIELDDTRARAVLNDLASFRQAGGNES